MTFKSRSFAVRVSDVHRQPKKETKSVTVVGFQPHSRLPSGSSPSWLQLVLSKTGSRLLCSFRAMLLKELEEAR